VVVAGSVLLFGVAGLVEGIFRQAVTNDLVRYALAGFNALWFFAWLFLAGREKGVAAKPSRAHRATTSGGRGA
jgi:hypothetical protein